MSGFGRMKMLLTRHKHHVSDRIIRHILHILNSKSLPCLLSVKKKSQHFARRIARCCCAF